MGANPVTGYDPWATRNLTVSGGAYIGEASITKDTTGKRARQSQFGGYSVGAGSANFSAMAYTGKSNKQSSLTGTFCGGICVSYDTDKGFGFELGFGVSISNCGLGN